MFLYLNSKNTYACLVRGFVVHVQFLFFYVIPEIILFSEMKSQSYT